MAPSWLTTIAWIYLGICFASGGLIACDIAFGHRRQPMGVMNLVYPITALYFGPFALAFYWRWGRAPLAALAASIRASAGGRPYQMEMAAARDSAHHRRGEPPASDEVLGRFRRYDGDKGDGSYKRDDGDKGDEGDKAAAPAGPAKPRWVTMATEVSHCGSGCALGDVISEFLIFALALTLAGSTLFAEYLGDYIFALAFGIAFQYFAIAPMRGLGVRDGLKAAAKADVMSLTAFEVGLFGWMAVMAFVLFPAPGQLMPNSAAFWLLMQVGMMIGFLTSWPANVWLVNRGIKVPM
jgi:hypothetical protein